MKKIFKNFIGVTILASVILFGCQTEIDEPKALNENEIFIEKIENPDPRLISYMEYFGLKGKSIEKFNNDFLVDGDLLITNQDLSIFTEKKRDNEGKKGLTSENQQYRFQNIVSYTPNVIRRIKYKFASSVPISGDGGQWRTATTAAFNEWNSIRNSSLYFEPTTGVADIEISGFFSSGSGIAAAQGPNGLGNPGSQIYINTYYNYLSLDWKIQTMAHEIGHTVGFHHTDYNTPGANPNNTVGILIAGTWTSDPNSIMNHQLTKGWTGFPYLDQLSIRTLYPLDLSEKPFYAYQKVATGGFNWTPNWNLYGFGSQGFAYWGFNGYVFTSSKPNTVPLYKYRNTITHVDYMTTNPNLSNEFPSYANQGLLAYVYSGPASDRVPVYEYYHPDKGFHFTTILNDGVVSSGGWTGGGIAFYVLKVDQFN